MLILTRRPSEHIVITLEDGRTVTVTILGIKGMQARIGVDAPKTITVHRDEIQQRVDQGVPMKAKA